MRTTVQKRTGYLLCGQVYASPGHPATSFDVGSVTVSATASPGLAVTFSSTAPNTCTVAGNVATFVTVGTCTVEADQAGNANYLAAPANSNSFTIKQAKQNITFADPGPQPLSAGTVTFTYSSTSSENLVTFASSTPAVCTIYSNNIVSADLNAVGTCTITASQAGDTDYSAATPVTRNFRVTNN
jgi:hypothetical protein